MIVILIPFFLVAQIPVEESAWKYGPEYTFEVAVNLSATVEKSMELVKSHTINTLLVCRPKNSDALSCHLQVPETCKTTNEKELNKINCTSFNPDEFEIKFNKSGVESLLVQKNISNLHLNIIKELANQLSIGANLYEKLNEKNFEAKENLTIGECKVNFKINHAPREQNSRKDVSFKLDILPFPDKISKDNLEIEKSRNLKDCTNFVNYVWGNYGTGNESLLAPGIDTQLDSVTTRMNVTDTSFSSCTHTEAVKYLGAVAKRTKLTIKTNVTLKNIEAAKDKLPVISNPGTTPIFVKINVQELKTNQ
ncbi:uncharacterized protein LOC122512070 [Leptopilina heterotoma]|uniref:uncharacterized protein LOC122512070 n=1 Tax=Leptopilina heterotoma TaxID=63436 RepID=UPI001CA9754A|nr:uncharacterized protein LOC122512070 [Leptopilina heterotoma]